MAAIKTVLRQIEHVERDQSKKIVSILFRRRDNSIARIVVGANVRFGGIICPVIGFKESKGRKRHYINPVIRINGRRRICRYSEIDF